MLGVGLGVPGPIDVATGVLGSTAILPGWSGINPREELAGGWACRSTWTTTPTSAPSASSLGQRAGGAGPGVHQGRQRRRRGLVINGRIYRGPGGTAGEIGHITLDESGPVCRCGNRGCLETFTAARHVLELLRGSPRSRLTVPRMVQLAREGDPGCRRVIADVGRHVGMGVANLCNVLNPSRVVLGGDLAESGELVLGPDQGIGRRATRFRVPARQLPCVPGALGGRAEVLGALALVLSEMGDSTLPPTRPARRSVSLDVPLAFR